MIFNKDNNGADELRELTGSYYNNNDFGKVKADIDLATAELIRLIGRPVYELAETAYHSTEEKPDNDGLVNYVQMPIAILAAFNMYRSNDISHEDSGRKVKIDSEHEKLPWEWQLKRDDEIQLDKYYSAVDRLIDYLNYAAPKVWTSSDNKKTADSLFINSAEKFDRYFPINKSGRLYMLLLPFIREAERKYIKPALGTDYAVFLAGSGLDEKQTESLECVLSCIPLFAMAIAVRRMPLGLIPAGVVRNYVSSSQTMDASDAASVADIHQLSASLMHDAMMLLNDAKKLRQTEVTEYPLLPKNDITNKFMRV